ncbi:MAG TPA: DUF3570 domain-containing protein [Kofleriaceae bacterium]
MIALCGLVATARADGDVEVRTVYYKERATRVEQPMIDAALDAGEHGIITAHFLVDAITSASASSGAINATPFTEHRYEEGIGYQHDLGRVRVGADTKLSTESDYRSFFLGGHADADFFHKNTVVGIASGYSWDRADNAGAQSPMGGPLLACHNELVAADSGCALHIFSFSATATQLLSPNAVLGLAYDVQSLHGFQANPYRTAIAGDAEVPERHPLDRLRQAFAASIRYYITPTHTTVIGAYRYYRDDWAVHAHTPELRVVQEVGRLADATLGFRYYSQDGAYFYRDHYSTNDRSVYPYVSDDVKLSTFTGETIEAKAGVLGEAFGLHGFWAGLRFEGVLQYVVQHNSFGNAVIAHAAVSIPFAY